MSSSSPAVLDPLAASEKTFLDAGVSVATVPRKERIAPDVTAIGGAEAVAIVRAAGAEGISRAFTSIAVRLPDDRQSLELIAQAMPLPVEAILAAEREAALTLGKTTMGAAGFEPATSRV